jgi:arylsulfatase A-like enzyme
MVQPGTVCKSLISSIDFLPTILEIAEIVKIPEHVDGKSFVAALKNPGSEIHPTLYWHFPHYHNGPPGGAVRDGKWKLIEWYENSLSGKMESAYELYDLENDLGETTNLSKSNPEKTGELKKLLNNWRVDVNAQMPGLNSNK